MWTFFVRNIKFTVLTTLAIAALGLLSMLTIDKESNPEVTIPYLSVATPFPGASALDVEQFVTNPLEDALAGIDDLKQLTSSSAQGFSSIGLEFEIGADIDKKLRETQEAITLARGELPDDAGDTIARQVSFDDTPVKIYVIGGPYSSVELKQSLDLVVDRLERIPGLTEARLVGGEDQEIRLLINPAQLVQFELTIDQVIGALRQAETNIPIGVIERDNAQYSLRFDARLRTVEDIGRIPVGQKNGTTVFLRDIATIERGFEDVSGFARLYKDQVSANALTVQIFKKSGGNILDVVDAADSVIEDAKQDILPEGVVIETVDDTAQFIREDLTNLSRNGLQTTVIVILLILVLLGWREALLAGLSIPLTFLITFVGLSALGYTINFLSLFSLILALGILVDAGIVMTEGIYENKQQGLSPLDAALKTIQDFKAPLISGTATTIFAFLPMMMTSGIIGEFIKSIPVTVTLVLIAALFVAIALIPAFFVMLLGDRIEHTSKSRLIKWFSIAVVLVGVMTLLKASSIVSVLSGAVLVSLGWYEYRTQFVCRFLKEKSVPVIRKGHMQWQKMEMRRDVIVYKTRVRYRAMIERLATNRRATNRFFVGMIVAFVIAMALPVMGILKVDMFPATDLEQVYIDVSLPAGTALDVTNQTMVELENYFKPRSEVESFLTTVGSGSSIGGGSGTERGAITVTLVERKLREDSRNYLDVYTNDLKGMVVPGKLTVQQLSGGPESGAAVELKITGPDLAELETLALQWEHILKDIEGTRNVSTSIQDSPGEIAFTFDRAQMGVYGVSPIQVAGLLRTSVFGSEVLSIREGDEDVPVVVKMDIAGTQPKDIRVEQLLGLPVTTSVGIVPLSTFVNSEFGVDRSFVAHEDGVRVVRVTSGTAKDVVAQTIFEQITKRRDEVSLPEGYAMSFGGQNEDTNQSFADLGRAMFLGVFMIAALLVWQFNSYRQPLMILSSIPMSLIGVFPGLALVGQPLSFPGMIGVVALAGIVVNNGIILIDRVNENRRNGMSVHEAVIEACSARLRPILLTTITTVAGLLPLALSEPSWAPLGFAIVFGLIFSTVLTLLSLPLLYIRFAESKI